METKRELHVLQPLSAVSIGIDIGTTTRLTDIAEYGTADSVASEYEALSSKASECIKCGVCMGNCPFGVDIIANMARAVHIFGR